MSLSPSRFAAVSLAMLVLTGFRMPAAQSSDGELLYDVRGAFVTAQPDVPSELIAWTDSLVDTSIQATTRSFMLPRAILTVRIGEARHMPVLMGNRYTATVTISVISVLSGEPVAEGAFSTSILRLGKEGAERVLAEKIAARIATEFRLEEPRRSAALTALSGSGRP
jgi:hypothetical protein